MTYRQWLRRQKRRDDPVGDLARDWFTTPYVDEADYRTNRGSTEAAHLTYLRSAGACEGAVNACRRAWSEYRAYLHNANGL
jgi:hypothetical protein